MNSNHPNENLSREIDENRDKKDPKVIGKSMSIEDFLFTNDITPTRQRVAIASYMFERTQHLSAEAVLSKVNVGDISVSKATVYNTLKLFVEKGILKEVVIDPQRILFDTNTSIHHHVMNVETGEIRDIEPIKISLEDNPVLQKDEQLETIDLVLKVKNRKNSDSTQS